MTAATDDLLWQALVRVVGAVRALHRPYGGGQDDYCVCCNRLSGGWHPYPCGTLIVMEKALQTLPDELYERLRIR